MHVYIRGRKGNVADDLDADNVALSSALDMSQKLLIIPPNDIYNL